MENRYRHERFPDLVRSEKAKAERARLFGTWSADIHYDVSKPFEHLFRLCAAAMGPQPESEAMSEAMWWDRNFEKPAGFILHNIYPASRYIAGNSPVASSSDDDRDSSLPSFSSRRPRRPPPLLLSLLPPRRMLLDERIFTR